MIVGGDGAINDAINGIMTSMVEDKTNIAFGIIPNGIGNDSESDICLIPVSYTHLLTVWLLSLRY